MIDFLNSNRWLFYFIGITGVLLLVISFSALEKVLRIKPIISFDLANVKQRLSIKKSGLYSISLLGAGYVEENNFIIIIRSASGKTIEHKTLSPRLRSRFKNRICLDLYYFFIKEIGDYHLEFSNINSLKAKQSMLSSKRIFQESIIPSHLTILIKEAIKPSSYVIALVGFLLGVVFASG